MGEPARGLMLWELGEHPANVPGTTVGKACRQRYVQSGTAGVGDV